MSEKDDINELRAAAYFLAIVIAVLMIIADHSCGRITKLEQRIEAVEKKK